MIMDNDIIIISSHDFEHLSRWYCRVYEVKSMSLSSHVWHNVQIKKNLIAIIYLLNAYRRYRR
jgi:hypothetical protein